MELGIIEVWQHLHSVVRAGSEGREVGYPIMLRCFLSSRRTTTDKKLTEIEFGATKSPGIYALQ